MNLPICAADALHQLLQRELCRIRSALTPLDVHDHHYVNDNSKKRFKMW